MGPIKILSRQDPTSPDLYTDHETEMVSIFTACLIVSFLGLLARVFAKFMCKRNLSADDYLLLASYVLFFADTTMLAWGTRYAGIGWHAAALSDSTLETCLKVLFADSFFQPSVLLLAKLSILVLYHEIFVMRTFRVLVYVLSSLVVAWWAASVFGNLFLCFPISARYHLTKPAQCGDFDTFNIATPIPWIATDLAILLAPLPIIARMHMLPRRKAAVAVPFLVGGLSCVASIVRYTYVFRYQTDLPWLVVPHLEWHAVEASVTILAVSLVISKPVVLLLLPNWLVDRLRAFLHPRDPSTYQNMRGLS